MWCCCLSGVCVSPLWACLPSETGFCPPPPRPAVCLCESVSVVRTENTCRPGRYGSRRPIGAGSTCRTGPADRSSVVRTENTCRPGRYGSRQDYLPYRHGRPGGRRLRAPVLPGGRNFGQKAQKGPQKKKIVAEFWLILPKSGRKGAAENFQKKFLIFSCDNHV